jgi:fructosamine-3-kinase
MANANPFTRRCSAAQLHQHGGWGCGDRPCSVLRVPEMDLAYIDFFHPVPEDVLNADRDEIPIDPGFRERRDLWRVYGYLAIVEVDGTPYLPQLINAVRKYL